MTIDDDFVNKILVSDDEEKITANPSILDKLLFELIDKYTQDKIEIKFDNNGLWLNIRYELKSAYDKYNKEIHLGDTVKFSVLGRECTLIGKIFTDKDELGLG